MKKNILLTFTLLLSLHAVAQDGNKDWANYSKYAEANKTAPKGADAVFMGNSITEGWVNNSPEFFTGNNFIGRGISGQVTAQMLARFRSDVLELEPKSVVILAGTNDIALNNGYVEVENIAKNIMSMAELANAHGIKVIICSVLPAYRYGWRPELKPAENIVQLNGILKKYAVSKGYTYVDYYSAMADERGGLPEKYARDGVHPTLEGYRIMEGIIKPAIKEALR